MKAPIEGSHLEAGLIDSLPDTFKKDPEARGTFDGIVVKHVETQTARYLAKSEKDLQDAEHSKTALATAKAATEAALAAAEETNAAGIAAEKATEATLKAAKAGVKQAQAAVNNFEKEMANFGTHLSLFIYIYILFLLIHSTSSFDWSCRLIDEAVTYQAHQALE